ncbi:fibronectin type III domain-containing protein [Candidatus Woesearchaeota archaeon]|nr:fibronectin type III domain-containing protein [Candidatus Woesearchaeota archaeon]
MDSAGNTNMTNDTIYFNASGFGLDITPSPTPTVVDDGTYTNTDISLNAAWNTTDPESELLNVPLEYEYRIKFNSVSNPSESGYLNTTYTYVGTGTGVSAHQLNLTDGHNYTFEARAINTGGIRSEAGESDGIIVDVSAPTLPEVNSTHLEENWTSSNLVEFNWTAADGISNVSAFSYLLNTNSSTVPDSTPEAETEHTTISTGYNDGQQSVLKHNQSGSASSVYIEVKENLTAGDVLRVTMQLAESHVATTEKMGARLYAINIVPTGFNMTSSNISEVLDIERDVAYVSDLRDATSYVADIQINTGVTGSSFFVAIEGSTTDTDNNYNLLLANSNASYDSSTQSYYCLQGASCTNTTNTTGYAVTVAQRDLKADGTWDKSYIVGDGTFYFHVKAQDKAGNFGPTKHYQARVDASAPSTPQMTEPEKATVNTTWLNFSWTQSTDPESGVDNYTLAVDNNSDFSSPEFYGWVGNETNSTVTDLTADTTYYARVHSRNQAGVNSSWSDSVTTTIDTTAPLITLSKPSGTVVSSELTIVLQTDETAECSGRQDSNQYSAFTFTNSTLHETRVSYSGTSFDVKCTDIVNNQRVQAMSFTVDTSAVVSSLTLQSPSVFTDEIVSTNVTVKDSSGTGLGEIRKEAFALEIGQEAVPFSVFEDGGGKYTLQFIAPTLNGSYEYKVSVTTGTTTVTETSTLDAHALLFIVQYTGSAISANTGTKMIYSVTGNFSIGLASDSKSVGTSSTAGGLNLSANAKDGDVFVFVTRSSGNVERVGNLLKDRTFLDAVSPSFGYQLDQDTFVVFTDLGYDDIALSGNKTLETGKFNLVIENKGFDSSVNKTKLEVRLS